MNAACFFSHIQNLNKIYVLICMYSYMCLQVTELKEEEEEILKKINREDNGFHVNRNRRGLIGRRENRLERGGEGSRLVGKENSREQSKIKHM